ncbi:uncharacterized protein [Glycine max]|uniref:uncharacterized protein n=1 Tax=Glycine max TaxID=3847 RepID=UPI001B3546CE|nr:uncharacterized protein LOC121174616 [Glycine max]
MMPMLDQFQPFMHDFIDKIVDVKGDGNCGYRSVAGLLGMGQDSWSVVRNHLLKELANFSEDYIKLFGGTERFEELRMSLLVDGLTKVTTDKWMDITDMGHVIASRSKKTTKGKGGKRFWKSIVVGFKPPREAIEESNFLSISHLPPHVILNNHSLL